MFVEGEVRGLVHVRGESPGSSNYCLYQNHVLYINKKRCSLLRVSPLQEFHKVKVSYIALLLVNVGSA